MSIPRKYRALIMAVLLVCVLGLADKAFSYRLTNFATTVVADLISEEAEPTAPPAPSRQKANAPPRPTWDVSGPFPSAAESSSAFSAFGYGEQPWISLGTPLDLDSTSRGERGERPGPRSTSAFQNPSAAQRGMARQSTAGSGSGGSGSGATSSGAVSRLMSAAVAAIQDPQAEAAGSATSSADLATAAIDSPQSLEAELWSELKRSGTSGGSGGPGGSGGSGGSGGPGGSGGSVVGSNGSNGSGESSRDTSQTGAEDIGSFGDAPNGGVSHRDLRDLISPRSLSEALALDSANGGPGLDVPTVVEVSAVLDVPGTVASDLGLDWLRELRSQDASDLSPSALAGESARREKAAVALPEPATIALFGIGVLALVGRLRYRLRRARS